MSRGLAALAALAALGLVVTMPSSAQQHDHTGHDHAASAPVGEPPRVEDDASEFEHSPPDPPATTLPPMTHREMMRMMTMDDSATFGRVLLDQLERRAGRGAESFAWDGFAWIGGDRDKAWLESEGERAGGRTREARVEALWDHVVARWWSVQSGLRHDFGERRSRDWVSFGVQGLAPGFFETQAAIYWSGDRAAIRAATEVDLRLTQRLVLQPTLEGEALSRADPARGLGSGVTDLETGLRLRYEIRREIAPFVGVIRQFRFGGTADLARAAGDPVAETRWVAGLRLWY